MKTILMSIQPKWVEKILNGEKTIEVRKFNIEPPFKVVMYCTNGYMLHDSLRCEVDIIESDVRSGKLNRFCLDLNRKSNKVEMSSYPFVNRKCVAEFVCDKVDTILCESTDHRYFSKYGTCLTEEEIRNYCNGKDLYGYNITDLKIYDKPKELGEFKTENKTCTKCKCLSCKGCENENISFYKPLTKAPQSFCYIQDSEVELQKGDAFAVRR